MLLLANNQSNGKPELITPAASVHVAAISSPFSTTARVPLIAK